MGAYRSQPPPPHSIITHPKEDQRGIKERKEEKGPKAKRDPKVPKVGLRERRKKRKKPKSAINKTGGLVKHQNRSRQN